eukprot:15642433-Heterocapsa_arctica.AAC.1
MQSLNAGWQVSVSYILNQTLGISNLRIIKGRVRESVYSALLVHWLLPDVELLVNHDLPRLASK